MGTKIVAGFPGTGKSVLFKMYGNDRIADSDSSQFSWIVEDGEKKRHPDFPNNYIEHIKSLIGKVDIICVSTHDVVRQALKDAGLEFYLVFPMQNCKEIYLENYKNRGNEEGFIKMIDENWDKFIEQLEDEVSDSILKIRLTKNTYIKDIPGLFGGITNEKDSNQR